MDRAERRRRDRTGRGRRRRAQALVRARTPAAKFVWHTRNGDPRRPDGKAGQAFGEACDALKLKGERGKPFTIHDLRDTFATTHIILDPDSTRLGLADARARPGDNDQGTLLPLDRDRKGATPAARQHIRGKRANVIAEGRK